MPTRKGGTVLVIPAAGTGSRLRSAGPKVLFEVNGRAMIDHLLGRYEPFVRHAVLVVHPKFEADVRRHVARLDHPLEIAYAAQPEPTGMLDALLVAADAVRQARPGRVWITWCDQIGVHPATLAALDRLSAERADVPAILPTTQQTTPYIHFERDDTGRIVAVRHRREGDAMPRTGESDMGVFSLSTDAYFTALPEFAAGSSTAAATGERNFLPFLPWLAGRGGEVLTFPATNPLEAIGVNTPEDRRQMEDYLRELGPQ